MFIDGSASGFITSLKIAMGENIHYERADDVKPGSNTKVIPVNFSRDNKTMI